MPPRKKTIPISEPDAGNQENTPEIVVEEFDESSAAFDGLSNSNQPNASYDTGEQGLQSPPEDTSIPEEADDEGFLTEVEKAKDADNFIEEINEEAAIEDDNIPPDSEEVTELTEETTSENLNALIDEISGEDGEEDTATSPDIVSQNNSVPQRGKKRARTVVERREENDYSNQIRQKRTTLNTVKNSGAYISGTIVSAINLTQPTKTAAKQLRESFRTYTGTDDNIFVKVIPDDYPEFTVIVPYSKLDVYTDGNPNYNTYQSQVNLCNKMVGAKIYVVLERIAPDGLTFFGNRKLANEKRRRRYYFRGYIQNPTQSSERKIVGVGSKVTAQVITTSQSKICLDVLGAQALVSYLDLTHSLSTSAFALFDVGEQISVVVKELQTFTPGFETRIKVSAKELMEDTPRKKLEEALLGEVSMARISRISHVSNNLIGESFNGYNIVVPLTTGAVKLRVGSIVSAKLISKRFTNNISYGAVRILRRIHY